MKHRREKREHGRILSVETKLRGDVLLEAAAAGATQLVVGDAGDFDEDGGWLVINDQVVQYLEVDDDEGLINLATGLTAAADAGDQVALWSKLYGEVVDYQEAEVVLDGEHDNPEAIVAEVAEGIGDMPEGDRGEAGESCTLHRVSDDEWEIVGVGGRPRKVAQGAGVHWQTDPYTITVADVIAGVTTPQLSHRPIEESVDAKWNGLGQEPDGYTVNYDAQTVTWPLDGFERAGDRILFHYQYRQGVKAPVVVDEDAPPPPPPGPGAPYNPGAWPVWEPTSVTATLEVFNAFNWRVHSLVNGVWKDESVGACRQVAVFANVSWAPDYYVYYGTFTPDKLGVSGAGDWSGTDMTGARLVGIQFYKYTGETGDPSKTPEQAPNGILGVTDPTKGWFYFGEPIAVTDGLSDQPMGGLDGSRPSWASGG